MDYGPGVITTSRCGSPSGNEHTTLVGNAESGVCRACVGVGARGKPLHLLLSKAVNLKNTLKNSLLKNTLKCIRSP